MTNEELPNSTEIELRKLSLDHAWNWFKLQADQRMLLFRFYLLLVSVMLGGCVTLATKGQMLAVAGISFFGIVVSVLFIQIDARIKFLLLTGFEAMKGDEEYISKHTNNTKIILMNTATGQKKNMSQLFRAFFIMCGTTFLVTFIYAMLSGLGAGGIRDEAVIETAMFYVAS